MQQLYISCVTLMKACGLSLLLLLFSGMAEASNYTFSSSSVSPTTLCSGSWAWSSSTSTWTCNGTITLNSGDSISTASSMTIKANSGVTLNGSVTIGGGITINGSINGNSANITLSANTVLSGTITYNNGSLTLSGGTVSGNVTGSGVTATNTVFGGTVTSNNNPLILSGGSVAGSVSGNGVTSTNGTVFGSTISSPNNSISLSGGSVAGNVSGNGVTTANTSLSNGVTSNNSSLSIIGGIIAGTITGNGITISNSTMTSGNITTANNTLSISNSKIGTVTSTVTISDNNTVTISSSTTVYGNVTAGSWSGALSIDSTSKVYGVCTSNSNSSSSPSSYPSCSAIVVVAEYRMDQLSWNGTAGEVVDSTGNGNDAYAVNGSTTTTQTQGKLCSAGTFNGTNQYLQLPNTADLNFGQGVGFTITTWIKTTDSYGTILSLRNKGDTGKVDIDLSIGYNGATSAAGQFIPLLRDDSGNNINYFSSSNAGKLVNDGSWHFLAITFNPANSQFTSFVDGSPTGSLTLSTSAGFTSSGVRTVATEGFWYSISPGFTSTDNEFLAGQIDELKVFNSALSAAKISSIYTNENTGKNWDGTTRTCSGAGPNHYELSLPSTGIACLPTTVTVTACADTSSPCSNLYTAASGQTATLATSAGTLATTSVTFDSTGKATTTLSYPAAANGASATVTLSSEQKAASSSRQCCPNGASCSVANSCSTTINTAGLIFSSSAATAASPAGTNSTLPNQVAGTSSGQYYLQAVQTNTTTMACQAGLTGSQSVNFGYQCNNPATCYTANLMSVNGGNATTVSRNNNGVVSSTTPVNLTFDSYGNAPFTFVYSDAGQVKLFATATVNSSTLLGVSNSFVAKPGGFVLSGINQTASPNLVNPAAANAAGAKFVKAGETFSVTVTATTSSGTTTPSFGNESSPESVSLSPTLVTGLGLSNNPSISGTFGSFSNGVATGSAFSWDEVGIITLTPSLLSTNYLGVAGSTTGTTTGNVGRFYPAQFAVSAGLITNRTDIAACAIAGCGAFTYMGEQMTAGFTLTAKAADGATTTQNYTTANSFAKLTPSNTGNPLGLGAIDTLAPTPLAVDYTTYGTATGSFTSGVATISVPFSIPRGASPVGPYNAVNIGINPVETDGVLISALNLDTNNDGTNDHALLGNTTLRYGRIKISNASGSQLLSLPISLTAQYWNGSGYVTSSTDNNSMLSIGNILPTLSATCTPASWTTPACYQRKSGDTWTTSIALANGIAANGTWAATLSKPGPGTSFTGKGSVSISTNSPSYLPGTTGLATFGTYTGNKNFIYMRENY